MGPTIRRIASYNTHQEYSVDLFGNELTVTVTSTPSVIRRWIRKAVFYQRRAPSYHPLVVGVGVQWTPAFYYYPREGYDPPADTLQLCMGKRCLIIQLCHCDRVPNALRSFLANPGTTFVGIWNGQDARKLERSRHHLEMGKQILDVRKYVKDSEGKSLRRRSSEQIVERCMGCQGVRLDWRISMSDWNVDCLDLAQILQASLDAFVCFELGVWARLWQV
ncbi:unnamed protein product [Arabis nemorensis]|uniref:3'-5' exonuclease domain-containing protein n=1 Tax=Arabis nemorensis TaxID=586526 RepID=A0A565B830_9BRAS|nr:unnamed protein product [Arabis nemorensis]